MNISKNSLSKIVDRSTGYISVSACRADTIRLLNLFRSRGIRFWGFTADEKEIHFKLGLFGCDKAIELAADANIVLTVEKRSGVPFILRRHRRRIGLAVGSIIAAVMVFSSLLFVWDIEIIGNDVIESSRIIDVLAKNELYVGRYIPYINTHAVEEKAILTMPELSSVAVVISGTHVTVSVIERERPPKAESDIKSGISSIYAAKDGIIVSVVAESGRAVVHPGMTVAAGDMLVSGIYDGDSETTHAVRSRATVLAKTYREVVISIPLKQSAREYTGNTSKKTIINILGHIFEPYFGEIIPFEQFDAGVSGHEITLFGIFKTPIYVSTLTAREYTVVTEEITHEEATQKAIAAFNSVIEEIEDGDIAEKSYDCFFDENGECITLVGKLTVIEDIGKERENELNDQTFARFSSERINVSMPSVTS